MRKVLYNYSTIKNREKRIYQIGNSNISSSGISVSWLKLVAPFAILGYLVGLIICKVSGTNYYAILRMDISFWLLTVGTGGAIGYALYAVRVQSYRLYEWLYAVVKPKYVFCNAKPRASRFKLINTKIDAVVRGRM